ncbi:MAG: hypothetical protein AAGN46_17850, partial [Acidobacteriota bacterium]
PATERLPVGRTKEMQQIPSSDRLIYAFDSEVGEPPGLRTRDVEKAMRGFRPLRTFQLRNGLQELVFVRRDDVDAGKAGGEAGERS